MGEIINAYKILIGKSEQKRPRDLGKAVVNIVMTFVFHKRRRISPLVERQSASEEGLFSMELVSWLVS
jgi:hypothetical protein